MKQLQDFIYLDKHKILDAIDAQPGQLRLNFADEMAWDITPAWAEGLQNIVLAGMGGSALAADVLRNWLSSRLTVPFEVVRGYSLPSYVDQRSLVIISSYSGNTEETLAALDAAKKRAARIVIMTAGGELLEIAHKSDYMLLKLPQVTQPRLGVLAGLRALTCLIEDCGFAPATDLRRELEDVADWLDVAKSALNLDRIEGENKAWEIAQKIAGKLVIIEGTQMLRAATYKWKININENSKQLAWCNVFPELNHNEMQGWLFPDDKLLALVTLSSSFDNPRVLKRMAVMKSTLKTHGYDPIEVQAEGELPLQHLLWTILLGDYVSAYVGLLNGIDPTPVDIVEDFKRELG
ncbi:MAG: bifunctional phosphoglucose/phosphomannose isomerase [bacterium]